MALGQAAPSMKAFSKATVAAPRIYQIIVHKCSVERNIESGLELESNSEKVEIKKVDFSYPSRPEVPILSNISLTVPAGKTLALVRNSGSGKSIVVSLIERFYDPTSDTNHLLIPPAQVPFYQHQLKGQALTLVWDF